MGEVGKIGRWSPLAAKAVTASSMDSFLGMEERQTPLVVLAGMLPVICYPRDSYLVPMGISKVVHHIHVKDPTVDWLYGPCKSS